MPWIERRKSISMSKSLIIDNYLTGIRISARGRTQSWPVLQQDSSGQEMAERLCPSAFNRAERAMIEGAEHRQHTLTGFPGASHVLSKLPFRTTPRCPVVLPGRCPPANSSGSRTSMILAPRCCHWPTSFGKMSCMITPAEPQESVE